MAVPRSAVSHCNHHSRWLKDDSGIPDYSSESWFLRRSINKNSEVSAAYAATPPEPKMGVTSPTDSSATTYEHTAAHTPSEGGAAWCRRSSKNRLDSIHSKSSWRPHREFLPFPDVDRTPVHTSAPALYAGEHVSLSGLEERLQASPFAIHNPVTVPGDTRNSTKISLVENCSKSGSRLNRLSNKPQNNGVHLRHARSRSCSARRSLLSARCTNDGRSSTAVHKSDTEKDEIQEARGQEARSKSANNSRRKASLKGDASEKDIKKPYPTHRRERSTTAPTEHSEEEEVLGRERGHDIITTDTPKETEALMQKRKDGNFLPFPAVKGTNETTHHVECYEKAQQQTKTGNVKALDGVEPDKTSALSKNEEKSLLTSRILDNLRQEYKRQRTPRLQSTETGGAGAPSAYSFVCPCAAGTGGGTAYRQRHERDAGATESRLDFTSLNSRGASPYRNNKCGSRSGGFTRERDTPRTAAATTAATTSAAATTAAATTAAATAAAAHYDKHVGDTSSRTSRLMRDFTDIVVVGKGSCGRVLKARHLLDGRVYAIKEIKFASTTRHLQSRMQLFLREVQCLRRLDCKENIVRYFSSWIEVNPLTKASACSHEEPGSSSSSNAPTADMIGAAAPQRVEEEEERSAVEEQRKDEAGECETRLDKNCTPSKVSHGREDRADECLSFYSVIQAQTTRHLDGLEKTATTHADIGDTRGQQCVGSGEGTTVDSENRIHSSQDPWISAALANGDSTKNKQAVLPPSYGNLTLNGHSEPYKAATTSNGTDGMDHTSRSRLTPEMRHRQPLKDAHHVQYCFSGKGERHCRRDPSENAYTRAWLSQLESRLHSETTAAEYAKDTVGGKREEGDAVSEARNQPSRETFLSPQDRQVDARATSMPAYTGADNYSVKVTPEFTPHRGFVPTPLQACLPGPHDTDKERALVVIRQGGRAPSEESRRERGEFEDATSSPEKHVQHTRAYSEDLSPALKFALERGRLLNSSAQFHQHENSYHTQCDTVQYNGSSRRQLLYSVRSPCSSKSPESLCLSSCQYESCSNTSSAADTVHDSYGIPPDNTDDCQSNDEGEHNANGNSASLTLCAVQSNTHSNREGSGHTLNCFASEKSCMNCPPLPRHSRKSGESIVNEEASKFNASSVLDPSTITPKTKQETLRENRSCLSSPRFDDASSEAGGASDRAGDKTVFQSAISLNSACGDSVFREQEGQQEKGDVFIPAPTNKPDVCRQSVEEAACDIDTAENSQEDKCLHPKEGQIATSSTAEPACSDTHSTKNTTLTFVALDDFWCCDDFGTQAEADGLEIVFAEETSPTSQKDTVKEMEKDSASQEPVRENKDYTLPRPPVVGVSDPSTNGTVVAVSPTTDTVSSSTAIVKENAGAGATAMALTNATQVASQDKSEPVQSKKNTADKCETTAASLQVQGGQHVCLPKLKLPLLSTTTMADTHASRTSRDTRRDRLHSGSKENDSIIDTASGDGGAVSIRSSPVSARLMAGEAMTKDAYSNKKRGLHRVAETDVRAAEKAVNSKFQVSPLQATHAIQQRGTHPSEAERGQQHQDQLDHRRWQTQEHQPQQQSQKPAEHQGQHHQTDASRATGCAGSKTKSATAQRVEVSLFIQMEYCPMSLDEYIAQTAEIDPARNEEIMAMIVNGLYSCHSAGIMHRDLKPSNIFIKGGGTVKLGDFGLAFSEDMDDDVWCSPISASPAGAKCLRDGLPGGSHLHPASAFHKDHSNRLSPAITPETSVKTLTPRPGAKRHERQHEQMGARSPATASFVSSAVPHKNVYGQLESWSHEPTQRATEDLRETALSPRGSAPRLSFQAGGVSKHEPGKCFSTSGTPDGMEAMKSRVFPGVCSDSAECKTACGQHQQQKKTGWNFFSVNQDYSKNEDAYDTQQLPLKAGHSLPTLGCTAPPAPVIIRVHSEEALRHITRVSTGSESQKKLDEIYDLHVQQRRQRMCCCPSEMQWWPPSAHHQHEGRYCLQYSHSTCCQPLWPDVFNSKFTSKSCSCPLDTPAPLLSEIRAAQTAGASSSCLRGPTNRHNLDDAGEKKQQEHSGHGIYKEMEPFAIQTRIVDRAAVSEKVDTHLEVVQQQNRQDSISREDEDRSRQLQSKKPLSARRQRSSPVSGPSLCCAGDTTGKTVTVAPHEPAQLSHRDAGKRHASRCSPSVAAHPVVVVQPPPVSSSPESLTSGLNAYAPLPSHHLLAVKGAHTPVRTGPFNIHSPEERERSGDSGDVRYCSEQNCGSIRISSPSGSHMSPAFSVLASPVFSNRTTGVGTSAYAPPEQLKGGQYDYSVDIWSLGLIAIDLFTRCETAMERAMNFRNAREGKLPPSISLHYPWVVPFCLWCLQKDPLQRPTIKQLYTHQCLTGSVFTPRSVLLSSFPTALVFSPPPTPLRSADVRRAATMIDEEGETEAPADKPCLLSAASCPPTQPYISALAATSSQHKTDPDRHIPTGETLHGEQLHLLCGNCGFNVTPEIEYKRFFKAPDNQYAGFVEIGGENANRFRSGCNEIRNLNQLWVAGIPGESMSGTARELRRGSTSPALMTPSVKELTSLRRSTSPSRSYNEAKSSLVESCRGLMHKPGPISALTLGSGPAFHTESPIRSTLPISSVQPLSPATTAHLLQRRKSSGTYAAAPLPPAQTQVKSVLSEELHNYSQATSDGKTGEVPVDKKSSMSSSHRRRLPSIRSQSESKGSPPCIEDVVSPVDPFRKPAQAVQNHDPVERRVSESRVSSFMVSYTDIKQATPTMDNDKVTAATPRSTVTTLTFEKIKFPSICPEEEKARMSLNENTAAAGTGKEELVEGQPCHEQWTGENKARVTPSRKNASASADVSGGKTQIFQKQCTSPSSAKKVCAQSLGKVSNSHSCTQISRYQHADNLAIPEVCSVGDCSDDAACEKRCATSLGKLAERTDQRNHTGEILDTFKEEVFQYIGHPLVARPQPVTVGVQANGSRTSRDDDKAPTTTQQVENLDQPAGKHYRSRIKPIKNQTRNCQHTATKGAFGKQDADSRQTCGTKTAEDYVHSAVKFYAQRMLNRYCELSSNHKWNHKGGLPLAALPLLSSSEDDDTSSGLRLNPHLLGSRICCSIGDVQNSDNVEENFRKKLQQQARQQGIRCLEDQHDGKIIQHRQKKWYSFEENFSSVPSYCGIMRLRGFLSVPRSTAEHQTKVNSCAPRRRTQIYVRSRRGEWKIKYAAVDKEKKLMYIFSDKKDTTKAKRVIQIEGEDGYCGVFIWEEKGASSVAEKKYIAQNLEIRAGGRGDKIFDKHASIQRRFSDVVSHMGRVPLFSLPAAGVDGLIKPCLPDVLGTPCRTKPLPPVKPAADCKGRRPLTGHLPKETSATFMREKTRLNASSGVTLSEWQSTQISPAFPAEETSTVLPIIERIPQNSTVAASECVRAEDTTCCKPVSGASTKLAICGGHSASSDGTHNERGADRKHLRAQDAEEERIQTMEVSARQTILHRSCGDCTPIKEVPRYVEELVSAQQRSAKTFVPLKREVGGKQAWSDVGEDKKGVPPQQHKNEWGDAGNTTSGRCVAGVVHCLRERHARNSRLDTVTKKTSACDDVTTEATRQHSFPEICRRQRSWFLSNGGTLGDWVVRCGTSICETDRRILSTLPTELRDDVSPGDEGQPWMTAPNASHFLQHVSDTETGSICKLNILLTHHSLLDDVWIRIRVRTSRPSCPGSREEAAAEVTDSAARKNTSATGGVDVHGLREELERGEGASDSGENHDNDEAVDFVESLMTCFEFAEVVGEELLNINTRPKFLANISGTCPQEETTTSCLSNHQEEDKF